MNIFKKLGSIAAFYLAAAYLIGISLFLVVLDYPGMIDPLDRVALLVEKQMVFFATNLILYVLFGVFLVGLVLALYERLKSGAPVLSKLATVFGIIWAGSLIASGMVANAGIAPVVALYGNDPGQAAQTWQLIETISSGLGNGNGEILGGLMMLLVSLGGLQSGQLPRNLNILGLIIGALGILTVLPMLTALTGAFGLGQMIWFVWLGIVLLRHNPTTTRSG